MELTDKMKDIHIRKNAGYAGDCPDAFKNFRESEDFEVSAFKGCMVRMSDKWSRIKSLSKNPKNDMVGESIKDTLIDLANYSIIAICLYEEEEAEKIRKESIDESIISTEKTNIENSHEDTQTEVFRGWRGYVG
jgi:nitrogen regulatory protein PII-like uncharacterized protein